MDYAPGGAYCVADTTPGVATFYDRNGQALPLVITIPAAPSHPLGLVGRPAGVVYNPTSDFVITRWPATTSTRSTGLRTVTPVKAYRSASNATVWHVSTWPG